MESIIGLFLPPLNSSRRMGSVRADVTTTRAGKCRMFAGTALVLASLRAAQLTRGCTPRVEGRHKRIVIAQLEESSGVVTRALSSEVVVREPI
jgi:hypothetical protein